MNNRDMYSPYACIDCPELVSLRVGSIISLHMYSNYAQLLHCYLDDTVYTMVSSTLQPGKDPAAKFLFLLHVVNAETCLFAFTSSANFHQK